MKCNSRPAPRACGPGGGSLQRDERILAQPLRLVLHGKPAPDRTICVLAAGRSDSDVAAPLVRSPSLVRTGAAVSCRVLLQRLDRRRGLLHTGRRREDLSGPELHVLHQLRRHLRGSQPYSRSNSSRDSWWVSLITLGEGYHNHHHTFPLDYRNGPQWHNVDPSKWLICVLSKLGLTEGLVRCN